MLAVAGTETDGFCCPICVRVLSQACATIAHSPSKEVGGDGLTFLCKACNSFLGTAYEAATAGLLSRIIEAKATGGATHKVAFAHVGGTRLYTDAVLSGDGTDHSVTAIPRGKRSAAEERFADEANRGTPLNLTFVVPGEQNVALAYLSWAYLRLFRRLGYVFVFGESGRLTRTALLSGSIDPLGPAFFMIRGRLEGVVSPVVSGLLVRAEGGTTSAVGIGCEIGNTVVALPLADDPFGRWDQLVSYTTDGSRLIVLPFDAISGPGSALPGIADYLYQSIDGASHRVLSTNRAQVMADLAAARRPPSSRPSLGPIPTNDAWPPPPLPLPPEPRSESWRATAQELLAARGYQITPSESDSGDEAWIEKVASIDEVAGHHLTDMRNLFLRGQDPRELQGPPMMTAIHALEAVAAEYADARLVAATIQTIEGAGNYTWMSARVLCRDVDVIVGPYYGYDTLVLALRRACVAVLNDKRKGDPRQQSGPTARSDRAHGDKVRQPTTSNPLGA